MYFLLHYLSFIISNANKKKNFTGKVQSWPFKARHCARAPPHAPCFVEVRNKHSPSKMFTSIRSPGNRTVCKKEELLFPISQ